MKFGSNKGVKTGVWYINELLRDNDINFLGKGTYQNFSDLLAAIAIEARSEDGSGPAIVIGGLVFEWDNLLTCYLRAGMAVSFNGYYLATDDSWGYVASPGDVFGVAVTEDDEVSFDSGGAADRIDLVEIRPVETNYNSSSRQFKDPVTGLVSSSVINTRKHYGHEFAVRKGTEGAGVAPARTAGWIKIAEVTVAASATSISQNDIKDARDSSDWTTEVSTTKYKWTSYIDTLLDDPDADTALNTLGFSAYVRGLVGGFFSSIKEVSDANYTVLDDDGYTDLFFDLAGTNRTCTLPTAADNTGRELFIKTRTTTSGKLTLDGEGTEKINQTETWELRGEDAWIRLVCDGTGWHVKGHYEEDLLYDHTGDWSIANAIQNQWYALTDFELALPTGGVWEIEVGTHGRSSASGTSDIEITVADGSAQEDNDLYTVRAINYLSNSNLNFLYKKFVRTFTGTVTLYVNTRTTETDTPALHVYDTEAHGCLRARRVA